MTRPKTLRCPAPAKARMQTLRRALGALAGGVATVLLALPAVASSGQTAFTPHRAVYDMDLAAARGARTVTDVDGRMTFTWKDVCDGWAIGYQTQMDLSFSGRPGQRLAWSYSAWEATSGARFRFFLRRFQEGRETLRRRGEARVTPEGGGVAKLSEPEAREIDLSPGTLFPVGHTRAVLDAARAGDTFHYAEVFDGTGDADGHFAASVAISPAAAEAGTARLESPLLTGVAAWHMDMAFFEPDARGAGGAPESEQSLRLHANGVAGDMRLDYGDFVVSATLTELEALDRPDCG